MVGAIAVAGSLLIMRALAQVTSLSIYSLNLVTGLGLGLAIDYSLFVVYRYREELARCGHCRRRSSGRSPRRDAPSRSPR